MSIRTIGNKEASQLAAFLAALIAKLKEPARSMVEEFANKHEFAALYDYLVKTFCAEAGMQVSRQELALCLQRDDETVNEFAVRLEKLINHAYWQKKSYRDEKKMDDFSTKILPRLQDKIATMRSDNYVEMKMEVARIEHKLKLADQARRQRETILGREKTPLEAYSAKNENDLSGSRYQKSKDVEYDPHLVHKRVRCDAEMKLTVYIFTVMKKVPKELLVSQSRHKVIMRKY